jgi:hypothetical protein
MEVEVTMAKGSGETAHVVSVTNNAGTRTIVLDRAITNVTASATGYVRVNDFKKLETFTDTINGWKAISIPMKAVTWIQFCIEMFKGGVTPIVLNDIDVSFAKK